MSTMEDRVTALEGLVATQGQAIGLLTDTVRALAFVNAALVAQLADSGDRVIIRTAALSVLPHEADRQAAALVEMLTREPSELAIEPDLSDAIARLH